jgi:hypothetical protein
VAAGGVVAAGAGVVGVVAGGVAAGGTVGGVGVALAPEAPGFAWPAEVAGVPGFPEVLVVRVVGSAPGTGTGRTTS